MDLKCSLPESVSQSLFRQIGSEGRILYALIFAALLLSGVQLQLGGELLFARLFYAGSMIVLVGILFARPRKNR